MRLFRPRIWLPPPAMITLFRSLSWNSGLNVAIRSAIPSRIGSTRISQACFISAVMSYSVGLPFTGSWTLIGSFVSLT